MDRRWTASTPGLNLSHVQPPKVGTLMPCPPIPEPGQISISMRSGRVNCMTGHEPSKSVRIRPASTCSPSSSSSSCHGASPTTDPSTSPGGEQLTKLSCQASLASAALFVAEALVHDYELQGPCSLQEPPAAPKRYPPQLSAMMTFHFDGSLAAMAGYL
ncbi:hypothetical protein VTN00DRAFT_1437 [Thermoascus crustaceus]|uniref:uncharacterized protein n=1 Tax=Thermoascus crustaceus TaxID=5088 RepID=UPI003743A31D